MTLEFIDGANFDGLFDIQGKLFAAIETADTGAGSIETALIAAAESLSLRASDLDIAALVSRAQQAAVSAKQGAMSPMFQIASAAGTVLVEMVEADNPQPDKTLATALDELIRQMITEAESVDASTVSVSVTPDAANVGDGVLVATVKRGDGLYLENAYAETIAAESTSEGRTASVSYKGEPSVGLLTADWPAGSGVSRSASAVSAGSSLLANGDMEDEDDVADAPDDWIISVGTVGTTLKMTNVEVQTITIAGTPTSGYYLVNWTNSDGDVQTAGPLAYNATAAQLQAALRRLEGLELVTVTATGTTPNFTHTVTFVGRGGNVSELTITSAVDTGTITPATSSAGTAQVYADGKALELDSNGSQLTTLNQPVSLNPATCYAVSLWAIVDVVPVAGVIALDLVDGIGGTVIQDDQGNSNSISFNAADLLTTWQQLDTLVSAECIFRTPTEMPDFVYFRLRISTAVSNTTSVFIDHVALTAMTSLYDGGPLVALFSGKDGLADGDKWTLAVANNYAGKFQQFYQRCFDMNRLGLLLPSNSGGSETIVDSLIS